MSEGEREPLLANEDGRMRTKSKTVVKITPLPMQGMIVLCLLTFSEPMSEFIIFPFVNEMVVHVGATDDPQKIGFYSGFIESLLYITAFSTALFWGRLSDRIGRRPVLLGGLVGIIISAVAFGFSETFAAMVISRAINGLLNGNSPVIRSVVAELTDKTNESLGFSLISVCWSTGAIIAPALGGLLARPAETMPSVFANVELFKRYPYALPCLAGASFSVLGLITGVSWLKETLGTKGSNHSRNPSSAPSEFDSDINDDENSGSDNTEPLSIRDLWNIKNVQDTLIASWLFAFISIGIQAVWLLWLYTPIASGGIGLSTFDLGIAFSFVGVFDTILLVFLFPPLQRRFGTRTLFIIAMWGHVAQTLFFPIVHSIALHESSLHANSLPFTGILSAFFTQPASIGLAEPDAPSLPLPVPTDPGSMHTPPGPFTLAGIGAMILAKAVSDIAFACSGLLVNSAAPSQASLGSVNGLMSMVSCLMRAIGPAASTILFAISISQNLLGGHLFWIVLLGFALTATWSATRLEKTLTLHELAQADEHEEEEDGVVVH